MLEYDPCSSHRNISPHLQAAPRAAVVMYISSASSSHFIFLRALLPQGAKLPALMCQSSCAINRPTLEKLQSLSCLARSTGIYPWYSLVNHKTSTRKQSFSTVERQRAIFSELNVQPTRISPLWLCYLRNMWHGRCFLVHWGCVHSNLIEGRQYLRPILDI